MKDKKKVKKREHGQYNVPRELMPGEIEPPRIYNNHGGESQKPTRTQTRRKQNKKRRLKNKVRKVLLAVVLFIVLITVGAVLSLTVFFKTQSVTVSGSGIYSQEQIVNASEINTGDNLFLINSDKTAQKITTRLPYIYNVKIKKELPATVKITVTDASAAYAIENGDKTFILADDNYKVLEAAAEEQPAGSMMITNAVVKSAEPGKQLEFEDETVSNCITQITEAIKSTEMKSVTAVSSKDINNNYIVYDGRITFELGTCDDLEIKIKRGVLICDEMNETNPSIKGKINLKSGKQSYFTPE